MQIFKNIGELFTLQGAAVKQGRRAKIEDLSCVKKAIVVENKGRIEWVGAARSLPRTFAKIKARERDLDGATVLPAFTECHTHLVFGGTRADEFEMRNQGATYLEVGARGGGILSTLTATRKASRDELLKTAQARVNRFIEQGVTSIECKSGYGLNWTTEKKLLQVASDLKHARIVPTFLGAHAIPKDAASADSYLDDLITVQLPKLKKSGLASRVDIFTEKGYFSLAQTKRYFESARSLGFDFVIHADQITRTGSGLLAAELGARSADHLLNINEADVARLAQSDVTCVLLPTADLYMNSPYPPARALIDQGARVALATDFNPGSAPSQDLSLVGVLARAQMKMSLAETVTAYTLGSAYALGLQDRVGSIEVGKDCDLVVLQGELTDLFYSVGVSNVAQTWTMGRRAY
jgi:imidazolonepropionase